jgi:CRISPR-associated endonuclease/helicase Cas3
MTDSTRQRLKELTTLFRQHLQEGLTTSEIANHLDVTRQTALKDIDRLTLDGIPIYQEGHRYFLDPTYRHQITLSLAQAWMLYLPLRRMVRARLHRIPLVRGLLHAVTALLRDEIADELVANETEVNNKADQIFKELVSCWQDNCYAEVTYLALNSDRQTTLKVAPWWFEPAVWSDAFYLVCGRQMNNGQYDTMTLKLDRIQSVLRLTDQFERPPGKEITTLVQQTWGIWLGKGSKPVHVRLLFHNHLLQRLRETAWHPTQQITVTDDGSVLWEADIAEPQELIPWIRGWGADVEVLEPEGLRRKLVSEVRRMAALYQMQEVEDQFIAHLRKSDREPQYLQDHLRGVSIFAGQFAGKIDLQTTGEILGLLHDLGKYSKNFQNYIGSATGLIDPDSDDYIDVQTKKGKIDHSSAGAQVIYEELASKGAVGKLAGQVLSLCIASHHSGLIDCLSPNGENNFKRRIEKPDEQTNRVEAESKFLRPDRENLNDLLVGVSETLQAKFASLKEDGDTQTTLAFKCGLLVRFLFSCLIDADRLDTADFEFPNNAQLRNYGQYQGWDILIQRLDRKLKSFAEKNQRNHVDELRSQISQSCFNFSTKPKNIYQLTVPTGGGKTLASLRFGLNHVAHHNMDRIFYIIPYTSIIDQNADEIRKVLEDRDANGELLDNVVLEHHSNLTPEKESYRHNLLAENWDAPIVFTTQVQFLETLFGSGTRGARRLHQLANAVIIFDEVQTLPIRCVHMFNAALRFLVNNCGSTVMLCTATQPLLHKVEPPQNALSITPEQKIIPNEKALFEQLRRVKVHDRRKACGWQDEEIADLAIQEQANAGSTLVVVNTKKEASALYNAICQKNSEQGAVKVYHLSTNMCPAHRLDVLGDVKERIEKKQPVICVSTQLIEAGVDIDFGAVIRYLAGLDSIIQAAGRCNRHGKSELGNVHIVNPHKENIAKLVDIKIGIEVSERVLGEFNDNPAAFENDILGLDVMGRYYKYYFYERKEDMKYKIKKHSPVGRNDDLFTLLSTNALSVSEHQRITNSTPDILLRQSFQTASRAFHAIDSLTRGAVVPYGEVGREIINDLCSAFDLEKQFKLLKQTQRYTVNLYPHDFNKMADMQAIREVQKGAGIYYLDKQYYSDQFGWSVETVNDMENLIL